MSLVQIIENAVDTAIAALGDAITKADRAEIKIASHIPGQPPLRTAVFTKCSVVVVAVKSDDFPETQVETRDIAALDIRPTTPARLGDIYRIGGLFYKVESAKNTLAGANIVLQEVLLRPSDNGGVVWA